MLNGWRRAFCLFVYVCVFWVRIILGVFICVFYVWVNRMHILVFLLIFLSCANNSVNLCI